MILTFTVYQAALLHSQEAYKEHMELSQDIIMERPQDTPLQRPITHTKAATRDHEDAAIMGRNKH